jgi:hypothetical protein
MKGDQTALGEVIDELEEHLIAFSRTQGFAFASPARSLAEAVLSDFASVDVRSSTVSSGDLPTVKYREVPHGARTVKLINIRFNVGTLLDAVAQSASAAAGGKTRLELIVAAVVTIRALINAMAVALEPSDALVLYVMWHLSGDKSAIRLYESVAAAVRDAHLRYSAGDVPGTHALDASLKRLMELGCIERVGRDGYRVVEEVILPPLKRP